MSVFEMIVLIVALSTIGGIISKLIKMKLIKMEYELADVQATDKSDSDKRLAEIEKRLIVLEQIVTSESYELNQQFKNIDNN